MSDSLDKLDDAALNELFAVEVAGFERITGGWSGSPSGRAGFLITERAESPRILRGVPKFCTDANAVLPWLEKQDFSQVQIRSWLDANDRCEVVVSNSSTDHKGFGATAPTSARAAVLALLRAKRAEKGQS